MGDEDQTALTAADAQAQRDLRAQDGLVNCLAGMKTDRDKSTHSYYARVTPLSLDDLEAMYRGSWIPGRIVSTVAEDMTANWVTAKWEGSTPEAVRNLDGLLNRLRARPKTTEALTWGRLHGGCFVWLGIQGDEATEKPLALDTVRAGSLQALTVFDRTQLYRHGSDLDTDPSSPNFGCPLAYRLNTTGRVFHSSRLIRFRGRRLPYQAFSRNNYWDDSELQHIVDVVKNYDTLTNGAASMVWEASVDVLGISGLAAMLMQPDGAQRVAQRLYAAAASKSFNKMFVIDKDKEALTQKTTSFAGLCDLLSRFVLDVCGAAKIPATILFGDAPSGLNATGDNEVKNYLKRISTSQESDLRPQIELLYDVAIRSLTGKPPQNLEITFNPLSHVEPGVQATIDLQNAQRDEILVRIGAITPALVAREKRAKGTYETMTDDDVGEALDLQESAKEADAQAAENARAEAEAQRKLISEPQLDSLPT